MSPKRTADDVNDSLSVKLGGWFEAQATGWGVLAIPIVVLIVVAAAALKLILFR